MKLSGDIKRVIVLLIMACASIVFLYNGKKIYRYYKNVFYNILVNIRIVELGTSPIFTTDNLEKNYEPYGYVAHALGSIDENLYTNTMEAFELSYRKGFRIFEVDMVLLKDKTVFCAHKGMESSYGLSKTFAESTLEEVLNKPFLGKYTSLTGSQLLEILNKYRDIYVITDTKEKHVAILRNLVREAKEKHPSVLERIIPHISGPIELWELSTIYNFKDYMLALYRCPLADDQIVKFVKKNNINAVMMWWNYRYTKEFEEKIKKAGAVTYVHSLNDPEKIRFFKSQGIGVYSDSFFPDGKNNN